MLKVLQKTGSGGGGPRVKQILQETMIEARKTMRRSPTYYDSFENSGMFQYLYHLDAYVYNLLELWMVLPPRKTLTPEEKHERERE